MSAEEAEILAILKGYSSKTDYSEGATEAIIKLYLHMQKDAHEKAVAEIRRGRKTSHWIWWEWPAFTPVRTTSRMYNPTARSTRTDSASLSTSASGRSAPATADFGLGLPASGC